METNNYAAARIAAAACENETAAEVAKQRATAWEQEKLEAALPWRMCWTRKKPLLA